MRTKLFKRLITGVLTTAMCVSMMAGTVLAAGTTEVKQDNANETPKITITVYDKEAAVNPGDGVTPPTDTSKPLAGVKFQYVKIGTVVQLTTDKGTQVAFQMNNNVSSLLSGKTVLDADTNCYAPADVQDALQNVNDEVWSSLMSNLESSLQETGATDADGSVSVEPGGLGLYLFVEKELPANATTVIDPFLVSLPMWVEDANDAEDGGSWTADIKVYPKVRTGGIITPEKEAGTDTKIVNAGETIPFTITIPIEKAADSNHVREFESFVYTDTNPGKTLDIDWTNATVKIVNSVETGTTPSHNETLNVETVDASGDYKLVDKTGTGADNVMDLELTDTGLAKLNAGLSVENRWLVINYSATIVNTGTNLVEGINNTASLTYSHEDQTTPTTGGTDKETLYSHGIDLTKALSETNDTIKAGEISFELEKQSADGTYTGVTMIQNASGAYWVSNAQGASDEVAIPANTASNSSKVSILGLDDGTYRLTELKTKDGYTKLANPITIEISTTVTEGTNGAEDTVTRTVKVDGVTVDMANKNIIPVRVENTKNNVGFVLPSTGGAGTLYITLIGAGLIAAAIVLVVVSRRKGQK